MGTEPPMAEKVKDKSFYLPQKSRLVALAIYVLSLIVISKFITGEWFPAESGKRLWLLSGIGLWLFMLISAPWFRPPRDSLANRSSLQWTGAGGRQRIRRRRQPSEISLLGHSTTPARADRSRLHRLETPLLPRAAVGHPCLLRL